MDSQPVIRWQLNKERRFPFGHSPDPAWFEPIGFPPPWPDRPWIFGVMVALSAMRSQALRLFGLNVSGLIAACGLSALVVHRLAV